VLSRGLEPQAGSENLATVWAIGMKDASLQANPHVSDTPPRLDRFTKWLPYRPMRRALSMEKNTTKATRIPGSPASRWESIAIGVHLLWVVMLIVEYYSRGPALDPPRCGAPYQVK